eukprot:NODE_15_length_50561_cov_0.608081.p31 type:complete len:142 gc:universal NODE_15_length_50561_cov_0.608081:23962-23537(-)
MYEFMKRREFDVNTLPIAKKKKPDLKYTPKNERVSTTLNLNLQNAVGKRLIHTSQQAGYVCKVCDLVFSDSNAYLEHINSRMHQIAAGISDVPEKVSIDQVLERIAYWENLQPKVESKETIEKRLKKHRDDLKILNKERKK